MWARKIGASIAAQFNKVVNFFWTHDPIAQMKYEYDMAVEQIKEGRKGLEQYRALVERVQRQVNLGEKKEQELTVKIKAYLTANDRETAGRLVVQLNEVKKDLEENREQLKMHEEAYNNNVEKIKSATSKLSKVKEKIQKYEADLKMSSAEAEISKLSETFNFNVTTDFGELEQVISEKIDLNRAKSKVAADLSSEGVAEIKAEKNMEKAMGEQLLSQFEVELGLKTPEVKTTEKSLGPDDEQKEKELT